ncbi:MAG: hypothetical protein HYZ57_11460 [Acidobacteria bacterium]|nr:hypothetical protein [Acidobacteriota bacterium]
MGWRRHFSRGRLGGGRRSVQPRQPAAGAVGLPLALLCRDGSPQAGKKGHTIRLGLPGHLAPVAGEFGPQQRDGGFSLPVFARQAGEQCAPALPPGDNAPAQPFCLFRYHIHFFPHFAVYSITAPSSKRLTAVAEPET